MFDLFIKNVSIEDIKKDAQNFNPSASASYHIAYPEFIRYFKDLEEINKHNIVIGAHFAYGWMPTIFDFRSNEFDKVADILNGAKAGLTLTVDDLKMLRSCFNNSLVGSSKILHFINPKKFAIWDSRICRYLLKRDRPSHKINEPTLYLDYLKFCTYITNMEAFAEIQQIMEIKLKYQLTSFRAIEIAMFGSDSLIKT